MYNTEMKFLEKSLSFQKNNNFDKYEIEVLVIDDGSDDQCYENIHSLIKKEKYNVKLIRKSNGGQNSARNYGLKLSSGEFVLFLDSDDVLNIEEAIKCVRYIKENNSDLCVFDFNILDDDFKALYCNARFSEEKKNFFEIDKNRAYKKTPNLWGMIIRRSIFLKNNFYLVEEVNIAEDLISAIILINLANKVIASKHTVYGYVQRKTSITNNIKKEYLTHTALAFEVLIKFCKTKNIKITKEIVGLAIEHIIYFNGIRTVGYAIEHNCCDELKQIKHFSLEKMKLINKNWRFDVLNVDKTVIKTIDFWLLFFGLWKLFFFFKIFKKHLKSIYK